MHDILEQVGGVAKVIATIASSAREQAMSLKEVSTATDQMDKVTQQNAAMVEETTAAAQSLASETEDLARLTERFQARAANGAGHANVPTRRPTAATSTRANARPALAPIAQMKRSGSGGAVPKAADDWEEF